MSRVARWRKRFIRKVAKHPLATLVIALVVLFASSILGLWLAEELGTLRDVLFLVLPPFLGQGPENPEMPLGTAIVWFIGLVASIGSLAVITALIVNRFIQICMRGGKVTRQTTETKHVVICGWNAQGPQVVGELLKAGSRQSVVILAKLEQRPVPR